MESGGAAEQAILQMAEQIERAIDDEMSRVDNMDDDDLAEIRKRRMKQLKEMDKRRVEWLQKGHGIYDEVQDLPQFFQVMKASERVIVHFMRRATSRCMILDRHLSQIAKEHFETKFMYVDVERHPSLAERFNIVMLPTLMLVEKQNTFHSIIGFDEFGGNDEFTTDVCCKVLGTHGMLNDKGMFAADQNDE